MNIEKQIEDKIKEIVNYERILSEYRGRWYDMGKRHLEQLKTELTILESKNKGPNGPLS